VPDFSLSVGELAMNNLDAAPFRLSSAIVAWASLGLLLLLISGCGSPSPALPALPDNGSSVPADGAPTATASLTLGTNDAAVRLTGVIEPTDWRELSFATTGQVERVLVATGDRVAAGDVLMNLNAADLELSRRIAALEVDALLASMQENAVSLQQQLARAEINLQLRQLELQQYMLLNPAPTPLADATPPATPAVTPAIGSSSPYTVTIGVLQAQIDAAQLERDRLMGVVGDSDADTTPDVADSMARLQQARLALDQIQEQFKKLEMRAPMDGIIAEVRTQPDDVVAAGETMVVLVVPNRFQVRAADLAEWDVTDVTVGQPAQVTVNALPDLTFPGFVDRVAIRPEETDRGPTYMVLIRLDRDSPGLDRLHWGMTANVIIGQE
jgi:multidrug resistance efflux pump